MAYWIQLEGLRSKASTLACGWDMRLAQPRSPTLRGVNELFFTVIPVHKEASVCMCSYLVSLGLNWRILHIHLLINLDVTIINPF